MSITSSGFCIVTASYTNYGVLGSPGTWGSSGDCAWCEYSSQTVYTNPSNPSGYTFQCDNSGNDNAMVCTAVSGCSQSGPGYEEEIESSIQTVTYVGSGSNCQGDAYFPDTGKCTTVQYVVTTELVQATTTTDGDNPQITQPPSDTSSSSTLPNGVSQRAAIVSTWKLRYGLTVLAFLPIVFSQVCL